MRSFAYCLIAALVGALVWGALLVYPLNGDILKGSGALSFRTPWPQQLAAFVLASVGTALVFRPVIRRMDRSWQVLFVSTLYVLAGSVAAGFLLVAVRWASDLAAGGTTGATPEALAVIVWAGLVGLTIGVAFLPVGIPIGIGGTLALRRIAGRVASA